MRKTCLGLLACALGIASLGVWTPSIATASYVVDDGPRFSMPLPAQGRSDVTVDQYSNSAKELKAHLIELINNTSSGVIRISLYGWDDWDAYDSTSPAKAVVGAINRGVSVRILLDAGAKLDTDYDRIKNAIAANPGHGSFIKRCGVGYFTTSTTGRACLGTKVNHNKYFLFSQVGSSKYVVVQSTSHLTPTWGDHEWDAMMTVVGKQDLYNGYVDYFEDQTANVRRPDYYRTVTDGNYKAYFFPRAGGEAYSTSEDTIWAVLNNVTCTGNTTVGTSSAHRTIIRILSWQITRAEVAKKIRALANDNCWIDIATNMDLMGEGAKGYLKGHSRINVDNGNSGGFYIHGKYLLIEGNYNGEADSKNIWVGSPNLTYPALKDNDEGLLKIKSASGAWHDAFRQNFRNIMAVSPDATWNE